MNPVLINGKNYDWANLTWVIFGVPLIGITEIEYDESRDSTNNYGKGDTPTSYGNKNFTYSGSISIYTDELRAIYKTSPGSSILRIPPFTAINIFSGDGVTFAKDTLRNIRFLKDPFAAKQNDSLLVQKIPFIYAGLKHE